eukprot:773788_1
MVTQEIKQNTELTVSAYTSLQKEKHDIQTTEKPRVWLSCDLRLDDFTIKNESFSITGWIDAFWKWPKAPKKLQTFKRMDSFENIDININDNKDETKENHGSGEAKLMY